MELIAGSMPAAMFGYTVILVGIVVIASCVIYVRDNGIRRNWLVAPFALTTTFLFGLGVKLTLIEPANVRWYLIDFGAPLAYAFAIVFFLDKFMSWKNPGKTVSPRSFLLWHRRALIGTFAVCCAYEIACGVFSAQLSYLNIGFGTIDPIVIVMYGMGTGIGLFFVQKATKALDNPISSTREQETSPQWNARTPDRSKATDK